MLIYKWSLHEISPGDTFSGLSIFWWMRIGSLLQFLGGFNVVLDLIGPTRFEKIEDILSRENLKDIFFKLTTLSDKIKCFALFFISCFALFLPFPISKYWELMFLLVVFAFIAQILMAFYEKCEPMIEKNNIYKKSIIKYNKNKVIITPLAMILEIGYFVALFYFINRKISHNYEPYIVIILLILSYGIIGIIYYTLCRLAIFLISLYRRIFPQNIETNDYSKKKAQCLLGSFIFFILGGIILLFAP